MTAAGTGMMISDLIEKLPDGKVVFAGTDVKLSWLMAYFEGNWTLDQFLRDTPSVRREVAETVVRASIWAVGDRAESREFTQPVPRDSHTPEGKAEHRDDLAEYIVASNQWPDERIITSDPHVKGGRPVFAWTRVPLQDLVDGILEGYQVPAFSYAGSNEVPKQLVVRLLEAALRRLGETMEMPPMNRNEAGQVITEDEEEVVHA